MLKISVVVPVYNVEDYLSSCIDSIRGQTFQNIEIICVDDGSTDRSGLILDQFSRVEPRLTVISKENGGLSSARNTGILAASGDIVCFVDSDDMLDKHACAYIAEAFERNDADVVTFGASCYPSHRSTPWYDECLSPRDAVFDSFTPALLFSENSHPFAWRTACRRSFLLKAGILFDEDIRFGEDELFHYALYPRSRKTVLLSKKLYLYRVNRSDSLMATRSDNTFLKLYDHLRIVDHICADWSNHGFINLYYRDLLHQIAVFVLRDVIGSPSPIRLQLLRYLRSILETYFTWDQLDCLLQDSLFGGMTRAVICDSSLAFRGKRKVLLYRFTLQTDPIEFVRAFWRRFAALGPIATLVGRLTRLLPMSSSKQLLIHDDLLWELEDSSLRNAAMRMLQIEIDSARGQDLGRA